MTNLYRDLLITKRDSPFLPLGLPTLLHGIQTSCLNLKDLTTSLTVLTAVEPTQGLATAETLQGFATAETVQVIATTGTSLARGLQK